MSDEQAVLYEVTDEGVGVVTLNRPDKANSQTPAMLDELNDVLMAAAADRAVKVIVLQANGKHFSAGHDISGEGRREEDAIDLKVEGLAGIYEWETKRYIGYSRAWRDIRKPTIAAVQGQCIAGGLLLCWPCDIIIAADNAKFSDPVVRMGIGGVEYHGHTWELGPRKAKEWLFTASQFTADEAEKFGMVNHVVPLDDLREFTMTHGRPDRRRCTRSRWRRPSARSTRPRTSRASTPRSSRCSTSTRPATATPCRSTAIRSWSTSTR